MKKVRRVYQTGSFREVCDVWASDRYRPRGPRIKGNARKSQMDANMKAAQREPDKYKGLQVRICGWSQFFNKLSYDEQNMMIYQAETVQ